LPLIPRIQESEVGLRVSQEVSIDHWQEKRIDLFRAERIKASPLFQFDNTLNIPHACRLIAFTNSKNNGLGASALPPGTIRLYQRNSDGSLQLVGDQPFEFVRNGAEARLLVGLEPGITIERAIGKPEPADKLQEWTVRLTVRNHLAQKSRVRLVEHMDARNWSIRSASHAYNRVDSDTVAFIASIPPKKKTVLTYRIRGIRGKK
jgi:hypothetical protein